MTTMEDRSVSDSSLCDRIVPGALDDYSEGKNELPRALTGGHD